MICVSDWEVQELAQEPYITRSPPAVRESVRFVTHDGQHVFLKDMLEMDSRIASWRHPWTGDADVNTKIAIGMKFPGFSLVKSVTARNGTNGILSKEDLARNIAERFAPDLRTYCQAIELAFEDLIFLELLRVSRGTWQLRLGMKVATLRSRH